MELQIGFQYLIFLPSWASFCTTFLENCGRGQGLSTATCLEVIVCGDQTHATCKTLAPAIFLHQLNFMETITLSLSDFGVGENKLFEY